MISVITAQGVNGVISHVVVEELIVMNQLLNKINVCRFCGSRWCAHNDAMTAPLSELVTAARRVGMNLQVTVTPKIQMRDSNAANT